jgi:hypothetical protein
MRTLGQRKRRVRHSVIVTAIFVSWFIAVLVIDVVEHRYQTGSFGIFVESILFGEQQQ